MELNKILRQAVRTVDRNSPTILTGFGVAGLLTTIVLAVKATVKAQDVLYQEAQFRFEQWEQSTGEDASAYPDEVFTTEEIVKLTWKYYIPTAGMTALTIGSIIFAHKINLRRNAALLSLYSIAQKGIEEYQAKVVEQIGEKKEEKIRGEIAQQRLDKTPPESTTTILAGNGKHLFYDSFSGRYFESDVETIRQLVNEFNAKLIRCAPMFLGINEFFDELKLEKIDLGDEMGWDAESHLMEVRFTTKMANGVPCVVIEYPIWPKHY